MADGQAHRYPIEPSRAGSLKDYETQYDNTTGHGVKGVDGTFPAMTGNYVFVPFTQRSLPSGAAYRDYNLTTAPTAEQYNPGGSRVVIPFAFQLDALSLRTSGNGVDNVEVDLLWSQPKTTGYDGNFYTLDSNNMPVETSFINKNRASGVSANGLVIVPADYNGTDREKVYQAREGFFSKHTFPPFTMVNFLVNYASESAITITAGGLWIIPRSAIVEDPKLY